MVDLAPLKAELARNGRLTLALRVVPKSARNEVAALLEDGSLKVKVTAAPEKGKANAAVCDLLAEQFGVPKRAVQILRGETSHAKLVGIRAAV